MRTIPSGGARIYVYTELPHTELPHTELPETELPHTELPHTELPHHHPTPSGARG
jgi:hypothetical protein